MQMTAEPLIFVCQTYPAPAVLLAFSEGDALAATPEMLPYY